MINANRTRCRFRGSLGTPLEDTLLGDRTWTTGDATLSKPRSPFHLNRYLSDDRVVCFQLVSKSGQKWRLDYVSSARATTDVPMNTTDFINQRRRWLNGAFFSTLHVVLNWPSIYRSGHSIVRLAAMHLQLLHSILSLVLAWFSLAAFLLTTFTVNDIAGNPPDGDGGSIDGFPFGSGTPIVNAVIQLVYIGTVLFQFILALGSRPKNHVAGYVISFFIFGVVQVYLMMNLIYLAKRLVDFRYTSSSGSSYDYINEYYADLGPSTVVVAGISIFFVYIAAGILSLDPWHFHVVRTVSLRLIHLYKRPQHFRLQQCPRRVVGEQKQSDVAS